MKTPTIPSGLRQFDRLPPLEAVIKAWTLPGPRPDWHQQAQQVVRDAMPVLARALDRASSSQGPDHDPQVGGPGLKCQEIDHPAALKGVFRRCSLYKGHAGLHYGNGREFS